MKTINIAAIVLALVLNTNMVLGKSFSLTTLNQKITKLIGTMNFIDFLYIRSILGDRRGLSVLHYCVRGGGSEFLQYKRNFYYSGTYEYHLLIQPQTNVKYSFFLKATASFLLN